MTCIIPDPTFVNFVGKIRKIKTRRDKDYFVMRATIPKEVAEKANVKPGDYLFFRVKKAEWYHMLNWKHMEATWQMLPKEVREKAIKEGIAYPGASEIMLPRRIEALGSTNPADSALPEIHYSCASDY